jgi:ankyrin repeat protein
MLLEDFNVDVQQTCARGNTALHYAASNNHVEMVQLLLAAKADVNALNDQGHAPLHCAASTREDATKTIEYLVEYGVSLNLIPTLELKIACFFNNLSNAATLIRLGAQVNRKKGSKHTPLMVAARFGHLDMAALLIQNRADVNSQNAFGLTALAIVTRMYNGWLHTAGPFTSLLLRHGADVNISDHVSRSPLSHAAENGVPDVVEMLLEHGVSKDSEDSHGHNALWWAVEGFIKAKQDHHNGNELTKSQADQRFEAFEKTIELLRA